MAIVQIFEKPSAQTAAAVVAQKKEIEVKKEFLELSRAPKVAAMVQEEYTTFKAHRAERHDRRWRAANSIRPSAVRGHGRPRPGIGSAAP